MISFNVDWDATFQTITGLNAQAIAAAATTTGTTIVDQDLKLASEVTIEIAYGATAAAATLYLLRDIDGTNFESAATDQPFSVAIPGVASSTVRRAITIRAEDASRFKVAVLNPTGNSSITVTVRYRQAVGTAA